MTEHIDPELVSKVFSDCLYRSEEVEGDKPPEGAVLVFGILVNVGFHPQRLESYREQVKEWLLLLPVEFRASGGGGWSFLNACNEADGTEWTDRHRRMEELFILGIGLGLAQWCLPRSMWSVMPGGMPYVQVHDKEFATEAGKAAEG